jgi:hypothetical protein
MRNRYKKVIVMASVLATIGARISWAGPPNPTPSDSNANTAGGTEALLNTGTGPSSGNSNTAFGFKALRGNTTGLANTASGTNALLSNTTGSANTASGTNALVSNILGSNNTATGAAALFTNTIGTHNTASGTNALFANSSGIANTATGATSLYNNITGNNNTATGASALFSNGSGSNNTASGFEALLSNLVGNNNTAHGFRALRRSTSGGNNTASGTNALFSNTLGHNNTASGINALLFNTTGGNNIALGFQAGVNLTTGSNNIAIGNTGVAGEGSTIRIGAGQIRTFIAGIHGKVIGGGSTVIINSSGQLGSVVSSARYKQDIQDMGMRSAKLRELRPVTFRYTEDAQGATQYGLVAEEVAKVYPELVVYGEKGEIESVQYHQLITMLLNELQQQQRQVEVHARQFAHQAQELAKLKNDNASLRTALIRMEELSVRLTQLESGRALSLAR